MRTGELGHTWENEKRRPWPPVEILDEGESQRSVRGPLACTTCGEHWPGTGPCRAARA